jgi:iron(III) transport system substrate-binding protein
VRFEAPWLATIGLALLVSSCGGPSPSAQTSAAAPSTVGSSKLDALYQAAKPEGEVVFATSTQAEQLKAFTDGFERKFSGIKVTPVNLGAPNAAQRFITESQAKRVSLDVATSGITGIQPLLDRDLMRTFGADVAAMGVAQDDIGVDGKMLWLGDSVIGWIYNTKLIADQDVPTKWEDLLDPKWRGKITLEKATVAFDPLIDMWEEAKVHTFVQDLAKLAPAAVATTQDAVNRVALGESAMSGAAFTIPAQQVANGAPIGVLPLGPLNATPTGAYTVKAAPHPNAALLLLAWIGSAEGKAALSQAGIGRYHECGPLAQDKLACGRKLDVYWIDTLDKAQHNAMVRVSLAKDLGFQ